MSDIQSNREQELRRALLAKPFVPFTLVMTDGERYEIARQFACGYAGDLIYIRLPGRSLRARLHNVSAVEVHHVAGA